MSPGSLLFSMMLALLVMSVLGSGEGVFDKIKAGLQNAKNYLETAREIADLVSNSLRPKQNIKKRGDDAEFTNEDTKSSFEPSNFVSIFFRLLGLDSRKVTAVAVNSFIFFAQTISELFQITPKVERARSTDGDDNFIGPMRLITETKNEKIQNLLKLAKDKDLPSYLMKRADGLDSSCIRLLLCKTSPFIWAAQESLENGMANNRRDITSWLPSTDKFEEHSDVCDDEHRDCNLNFSS